MPQVKGPILGIDGGGTKTHAVIVNDKNRILGEARTGPSNYRVYGKNVALANIRFAIERSLRAAQLKPKDIIASGFGIAALDNTKERRMMQLAIRGSLNRYLGRATVVVNDVIVAFRTAAQQPYGVAVISGTGSHAYARGRNGREAFVSGLGPLFTDDGSAYALGRSVMRAAAQSEDGRIAKTRLEQMVKTELGVQELRDATHMVYGAKFSLREVASFARLADRAAKLGDPTAKNLIRLTSSELASIVITAIRKAGLVRSRFPIILIGGMFNIQAIFLPTLKRKIHQTAPKATFVLPTAPFALGAAFLARDRLENNSWWHDLKHHAISRESH